MFVVGTVLGTQVSTGFGVCEKNSLYLEQKQAGHNPALDNSKLTIMKTTTFNLNQKFKFKMNLLDTILQCSLSV